MRRKEVLNRTIRIFYFFILCYAKFLMNVFFYGKYLACDLMLFWFLLHHSMSPQHLPSHSNPFMSNQINVCSFYVYLFSYCLSWFLIPLFFSIMLLASIFPHPLFSILLGCLLLFIYFVHPCLVS